MFQGFSEETIQFLWGVTLNNERSWFQAHKQEYLTHLYRPMQELGREVYDEMLARHPELEVNLKVTRIYRDARRLHSGGPYKDHLWLSLERPHDQGEWHGIPALWFEIRAAGYEYGLGYWGTPRDMEVYRRRIQRDPATLEKLVRAFNRQDTFQLSGECYKKSKGSTTALLETWYNRKYLSFTCAREPDELLFSPSLVPALLEGFELLLPLYHYFDQLRLEPPVTDRIL